MDEKEKLSKSQKKDLEWNIDVCKNEHLHLFFIHICASFF